MKCVKIHAENSKNSNIERVFCLEIDKKQIMNRLDSISDEDLKEMILMIAKCSGVSDRRAERAVSDVSKLRRGLGSMSEKELTSALSSLDEQTVMQIKKQMNM